MDVTKETVAKAQGVKLFAFDVDGVMSDGGVVYSTGGTELKAFHAQDGLGIVIAQKLGFEVAIITGRVSSIVQQRFEELGVRHIVMGSRNKTRDLEEICASAGLTLEQVAYMGDDLNDLGCMSQVGFPMTPANGRPENKALACLVTDAMGGHGAVREAIEYVAKAQELWELVVARFQDETYAK